MEFAGKIPSELLTEVELFVISIGVFEEFNLKSFKKESLTIEEMPDIFDFTSSSLSDQESGIGKSEVLTSDLELKRLLALSDLASGFSLAKGMLIIEGEVNDFGLDLKISTLGNENLSFAFLSEDNEENFALASTESTGSWES